MKTLIFILTCLILTIPCNAETIIVDGNDFYDFKKIQDAINYSWHGDVIEVRPGAYPEQINFYGKAITVTSTDPNNKNLR